MTTERKKHHPIRRQKRSGDRPQRETSGDRRYGAAKRPDELEEDAAPRRERRALSHVGGEVLFKGGSEEDRSVLAQALDVSADEDEVMLDMHGFHSYPARLHPATARGLIAGFSQAGDRVLDPFCGSGTVVVEGRALGREAIGSDLNPLAVELAWLKSRGPTKKLVSEMVASAQGIAEVAEERRQKKAEPFRRYSDEDRERYPIHVLLELDSLARGIHQLSKPDLTRMLRLVISSTLTKLSHSEGDTTRRKAPRRLPSGFAIKLFHQKAEELGRRLDDYRARLPDKGPRAYVGCSDARELEQVESDSIDLIITSPPYPGVYDYLDHHLHRIEFLGLREGSLREQEIGARREYRYMRVDEAAQMWRNEIGPTLYELRRTLTNEGRGVMIIADSVVDRRPLYADEQIEIVAERAGIDITCIASQERPLFLHGAEQAFRNRPRMEHVVVFRPKRYQKHRDRNDVLQEAAEARDNREKSERFQRHDDALEEAREQAEATPPRDSEERPQRPQYDGRGPRHDDRGSYRNDRGPRHDDRGSAGVDRSPRRDDHAPRRDDRGPSREEPRPADRFDQSNSSQGDGGSHQPAEDESTRRPRGDFRKAREEQGFRGKRTFRKN